MCHKLTIKYIYYIKKIAYIIIFLLLALANCNCFKKINKNIKIYKA